MTVNGTITYGVVAFNIAVKGSHVKTLIAVLDEEAAACHLVLHRLARITIKVFFHQSLPQTATMLGFPHQSIAFHTIK